MYGREVPAYATLVEVTGEVNAALGVDDRVMAERHGAIRVGTPRELRQVGQIFRGFGMYPVGFYDLRDSGGVPVPVVSTAFRPIDAGELELNPFRVFTSMLTVDDDRFFSPELRGRLETYLQRRNLFGNELLKLASRAEQHGGLADAEADRFVELATAAFELSTEPTDRRWYSELAAVSAVAADVGGVTRTHVNHLTPRVLDIDELYRRLAARGLRMIDKIQGPARWNGPDVLLRQTSFRALDETRMFTEPDGTVVPGTTRVRFGEVEQRGIALTPLGRQQYDALTAATDAACAGGLSWQDAGRAVWEASEFPTDEDGLRRGGLAYFTFAVDAAGAVVATPIVYEDFLPRSAAGIFRSNLTGDGAMDEGRAAAHYDLGWLADTLGCVVSVPEQLYAAQSLRSVRACCDRLATDPHGSSPNTFPAPWRPLMSRDTVSR
jgi:uncharacterized glyoxalase superfamily metalloenzyme YdcJ